MDAQELNRKLMEWAQEPDGFHLLSVLEQMQTLIIDLQQRVAELEAQQSDSPEFDSLEHDSAGMNDDWGDETD